MPADPTPKPTPVAGDRLTALDTVHTDDAPENGVAPTLRRKLLVRSGIGFAGVTALGAAGLAGLFVYHGSDLPDVSSLKDYRPNLVSRVVDRHGRRVEDFWETDRDYVAYADLPKRLIQAVVAAEDARFFGHGGVDFVATARAAATSALSLVTGERLVGGSTITQQLAKNIYLSRDRRLRRKIREIILARRIDGLLSKERILEIYLNEIYLGRQAYGVAAAARAYFDKPLEALSLGQIAFLAGLPKAPSRYDPAVHRRASEVRRNYVIGRMLEEGFITPAEAKQARDERIVTADPAPRRRADSRYFADAVKRDLLRRLGPDEFARGGYRVVSTVDLKLQKRARAALRDGLVAYDRRHGWRGPLSTVPKARLSEWRALLRAMSPPPGRGNWRLAVVLKIERSFATVGVEGGATGQIPLSELRWARSQKKIERPGKPTYRTAAGPYIRQAGDVLKIGDVVLVERLVRKKGIASKPPQFALRQIPEVTGALVAMDPHTGRVLAMTGGFSFELQQYGAASRARRQPGSAFKPFVYLAALEANLSPATIVHDEPFQVTLADGTVYKPRNYAGKHLGALTLRRALELSRNTVAVRIASHVGLPKVAELGKRFRVADDLPAYYSMALGSLETTPLRLATAYAMLANGGKPIRATFADRIVDRDGKLVYRHTVPACPDCGRFGGETKIASPIEGTVSPVADPRSIYQLITLMRGVVQRGTGATVGRLGLPIAGKTGTTNDHRDAWFVGFTTDLVVAVWVGFEDNRSLGLQEQGGATAAPIFRDFMAAAVKGRKIADFRPPKGVVRAPVVVVRTDEQGEEVEKTVYEVLKRGNSKRLFALKSLTRDDDAAGDDVTPVAGKRADAVAPDPAGRSVAARRTASTRPAARTPARRKDMVGSGYRFADHNAFR